MRLREDFPGELPVVALTCIDPRLNRLFPELMGLREEDLIWLRNSGNVIFDPMSSMTRTVAMACAIKGGKEIAIIGHTDCKVASTSVSRLLDIFKELEIDRSKLPENLVEFFGLFASERQNVINGVNHLRGSPLIGRKIPVQGLLVDISSRRFEWIVNGYEMLGQSPLTSNPTSSGAGASQLNIGEMRFPQTKIGEAVVKVEKWVTQVASKETAQAVTSALQKAEAVEEKMVAEVIDWSRRIDHLRRYKIIGSDKKQYGPIPGATILKWLEEGRIDGETPAQTEGSHEWKPLAQFAPSSRSGPPKLDSR